jgi:hypothetical protein
MLRFVFINQDGWKEEKNQNTICLVDFDLVLENRIYAGLLVYISSLFQYSPF